ncbi:MAG: cytochrome c [Candidatus Eremiobacteraeota bacterium]|nr:cytochrome c [Candidatus Eremiobacteraeota bacterium]
MLAGVPVAAQGAASAEVARGEYLVRIGDCEYCHTEPNGKPFAGGRAIPTPFGVIYSINITPDRDTGIGLWSEQDFYKAMHTGISRDGSYLYPAFPYPWFTKVTRADVDAIKAYLETVAPVAQNDKTNRLPWILSWRGDLFGWNLLFFDEGEYKSDTAQSAQWNRGAYLVQGLAHCGACHTPDNWLGGTKHSEAFEGGNAGMRWAAPGLGGNIRDGVGGWSVAEIVEYLKTGANAKSASAGPMSDVVMNSTQYLSDADLNAIALYLKNRPNERAKSHPKTRALGTQALARGQALYLDNCTACHNPDGRGVPDVFPPLTGSAAIQADNPGTVIHVVLAGARMAAPLSRPTGLAMPGFSWKLDDREIADVVNYARHAWGNRAPLVDAATVAAVRKDIEASDRPSRDGTPTAHPDTPVNRGNP